MKAFQGLSPAIKPLGRRREKKRGVGGGQWAWKILRNCLWLSFSCEISLKFSPWLISFVIPFKSIVWADLRQVGSFFFFPCPVLRGFCKSGYLVLCCIGWVMKHCSLVSIGTDAHFFITFLLILWTKIGSKEFTSEETWLLIRGALCEGIAVGK